MDAFPLPGPSLPVPPPAPVTRAPERRPAARSPEAPDQDALLALDIETVPDPALMPPDWPADRFPKPAWHRIVAISFVEADIVRGQADACEAYRLVACRSGGQPSWDEGRLLRAFWRYFGTRDFRVVTWNGWAFDMAVLLQRSMLHAVPAWPWFRRGTRWSGYGNRYAGERHTDLMDEMSAFGAAGGLTLEEAAGLVGLPGKLGEHGSLVADLVARGELRRVRDYCETDALNTLLVYRRHAYLAGRIDAAGHDGTVGEVQAYLERERAARPHLGRYLDAWRGLDGVRPALVGLRSG